MAAHAEFSHWNVMQKLCRTAGGVTGPRFNPAPFAHRSKSSRHEELLAFDEIIGLIIDD
jgi:hypothetical protein